MIDLVLKWSPRRRPDAIERHRQVASELGSVWWGRQTHAAGVAGLATEWLEEFRNQLASGSRTFVFLHNNSGGTWQTQLLHITTDSDQVDARLVPSHYDPCTHHSLWVNLTRFRQAATSDVTERYVLARTGEPVTLKSLNSQAPLLILRRRNDTWP
jgi:hypothetical protein